MAENSSVSHIANISTVYMSILRTFYTRWVGVSNCCCYTKSYPVGNGCCTQSSTSTTSIIHHPPSPSTSTMWKR